MDSNLTADSLLLSTLHDRERREQRQISKITLKEARRYGMAEKQSKGRIRYTYAGHVFIYDPKSNRAITSWKIDSQGPKQSARPKKKKESKSGTRFQRPVMIQKSANHDTAEVLLSHSDVTDQVQILKQKWTSHTVLVVDMSGSMREDDVNGARCRADGVWTTLARDYVRQQLENETCSVYDVVSVIVMRTTARVVIKYEPMTWVLYNKLVSFREWDNLKPHGHGFYKPALEKAEELLSENSNGACSLSLLFFSDGKPSDFYKDDKKFNWVDYEKVNKELVELSGKIASKFGRRLNIVCIGMADKDENFQTMERMATESRMFGAQASFNRPSLNTDSLSQIINSSVASSLASKTEMTSLKTGKIRSVRTDVERERLNAPEDVKVSDDWRVFQTSDEDMYVMRVWAWSTTNNDFAELVDPRCRVCFKMVADKDYDVPGKGMKCTRCLSCFFCERCIAVGATRNHTAKECSEYSDLRRRGFLLKVDKCPLVHNVAWKKKAFGEGAERLAFKFRFTNRKGKFIGPVMVAKESRFIEDFDDSATSYLRSHRHTYHKTFMRTQATAERFASMFNEAIDEAFGESKRYAIPRILFVKPLIFELEDRIKVATYNILVEPLIEGKYRKFTKNYGTVTADVKGDFSVDNHGVDLASAALLLGRKTPKIEVNPTTAPTDLGIIEEGSEEESDDESIASGLEDDRVDSKYMGTGSISDIDYLEAFSHFTYVRSGGRLMVVDLQGALQTDGGNKSFVLTDPAIHHRRKRHELKRQFGRTDLGRKGMRSFFEFQRCNDLCRLFGFREKNSSKELERLYRTSSRSSRDCDPHTSSP